MKWSKIWNYLREAAPRQITTVTAIRRRSRKKRSMSYLWAINARNRRRTRLTATFSRTMKRKRKRSKSISIILQEMLPSSLKEVKRTERAAGQFSKGRWKAPNTSTILHAGDISWNTKYTFSANGNIRLMMGIYITAILWIWTIVISLTCSAAVTIHTVQCWLFIKLLK